MPLVSGGDALTASKSPGEAAGKPASMTSTLKLCQLARDLDLLGHGEPGAGRLLTVAQGRVEDPYWYVGGHHATPSAASPFGSAAPLAGLPAPGRR